VGGRWDVKIGVAGEARLNPAVSRLDAYTSKYPFEEDTDSRTSPHLSRSRPSLSFCRTDSAVNSLFLTVPHFLPGIEYRLVVVGGSSLFVAGEVLTVIE
jgi:hypothetical protein